MIELGGFFDSISMYLKDLPEFEEMIINIKSLGTYKKYKVYGHIYKNPLNYNGENIVAVIKPYQNYDSFEF